MPYDFDDGDPAIDIEAAWLNRHAIDGEWRLREWPGQTSPSDRAGVLLGVCMRVNAAGVDMRREIVLALVGLIADDANLTANAMAALVPPRSDTRR